MQLTIFDLEARTWKEPRAAEPKENIREHEQNLRECEEKLQHFEDYIGKCDYCEFLHSHFIEKIAKAICPFKDSKMNPCVDGSHWLPDGTKIPGLCGCCKHGNCFEYEGESHNPIEEPNIYCEHDDGSLNRYCPYEKYKQERFGVGTWHRQHEYDTCERWEKE